jgi:dUTP pyrophosphatase
VDTIQLHGLTFYGYHGVHAEEQRLGQRFVVDADLRLDLKPAGRSDALERTVNYSAVARVLKEVIEGRPFKLIEALAEALAAAILDRFPPVQSVRVRVAKPGAPVAVAPSGLVAVEIERGRSDTSGRPEPRAISGASDLLPGQPAPGSVLSAATIRELLKGDPPLVHPVDHPDEQIQPNGIDVRLEGVHRLVGVGVIGAVSADRSIPVRTPLDPDASGWFHLAPGAYMIRLVEEVALPNDLMAFARPRSSLLRCGAALHTAVWDAGYRGRSESLLVVYAESGVRLQVGARVLQLVFVRLDSATLAYDGAYQHENVRTP